jgi:ketosteroid isomerase-like protein
MTATSAALKIALSYYRAWTGGRFDHAMTYLAEDVVCEVPPGRIEGAAAFRQFLEPFAQRLISSSLLAGFGDEETALITYDTKTALVSSGPAADHLTVQDGKIIRLRMIFDRLPGVEARASSRST